MDTNIAIDLSLRSVSPGNKTINYHVPVVRPIPRPPWAIMWYQSLWALHPNHVDSLSRNTGYTAARCELRSQFETTENSRLQSIKNPNLIDTKDKQSKIPQHLEYMKKADNILQTETLELKSQLDKDIHNNLTSLATVLDIACCDGPVAFEKVSNPNFALTVEHNESTVEDLETNSKSERRHLALKTYLCIYCNQSFKSLFCYQKHKKRHLNPVSVDITATTHTASNCFSSSENKAKTKDLNVQFFPCKKCGCKFPSYYFVHKHRKVCH